MAFMTFTDIPHRVVIYGKSFDVLFDLHCTFVIWKNLPTVPKCIES